MKVVLKFSPTARRYRNRSRDKMLRELRPNHASIATWSAVDADFNRETAEVTDHSPDAHKWARYLPIYDTVVDRARPIRMLEIGSFYGDSLRIWREYLHPDSLIVSIDTGSKLTKIADQTGTYVRFDSEHDSPVLSKRSERFGPFDVILDAGSLTSYQMADSFRDLFSNALNDGGVYLVEDVYFDYWTFFTRVSPIDLAKGLVDAVYGHYQIATSETNFTVGPLVVVRRTAQS